MKKFKSKYKVHKRLDSQGRHKNPDDTYLRSKFGEIFRYDENLLAVWLVVKSGKLIVPNRLLVSIRNEGVQIYELLEDDESLEFYIDEKDLDTVAEIMKIRRKKEKQIMDKNSQEYKQLIERLQGKK